MIKFKNTKRALLASGMALILCVSMLVGSTFAWFTDSVSTAGNTIQSGKLQVDLVDENGVSLENKVLTFEDKDQNNLWEPGCTYKTQEFFVKNNGNLALQYQIAINGIEGSAKLLEAIEWTVTVDGVKKDIADLKGTLLEANKQSAAIVLSGHMKEEAGNEYQGLTVEGISVSVFATQYTHESDSKDNQYDKGAVIAATAEEAQEALDNAVPGTTIYLTSGVDYGTLYLRPVAGQANTITDCDYLVYRNEMLRKVENLTIVGAPGATVDALVTVAGYVKDSGSTGYVVDIKNLVIDSVEFNDTHTNAPHSFAAPAFIDLTYTNVNGLTVKNCKLIGNNDKMNFVYFYGSGKPANSTFETAAKNITITSNTVDGIARLCELRQAENVTISNNTIKNTAQHGMLLAVDKGTYSGDVTISGNKADGINERFVRMAGAGDANVVIKNNTITNYLGEDADYIKVTDTNGTPIIENNTLASVGVKDADKLADALANGGNIVLASDVKLENEALAVEAGQEVVIDLNGKTLSTVNTEAKASAAINNKGTLTLKNGTVTYKGVGDPNFGYGTNTIHNTGKLVIDGATIINTTDSGSSVAIDCAAGAELIVNSGVIKSVKNAIRLCPFGSAAISCTINGGEITGARAVQIQLPSNKPADAPKINLTINGGEFNSTSGLAIYSYSAGQSFANVNVSITGGTFNGDVQFGGGSAKTTTENVTITGGTFNGYLGRWLVNDAWKDIAKP